MFTQTQSSKLQALKHCMIIHYDAGCDRMLLLIFIIIEIIIIILFII